MLGRLGVIYLNPKTCQEWHPSTGALCEAASDGWHARSGLPKPYNQEWHPPWHSTVNFWFPGNLGFNDFRLLLPMLAKRALLRLLLQVNFW